MQTTKEKKISPTDAIQRMIFAINQGNGGDFYKIADEFAEGLASGGQNRYKIKNAIRQKPMTMRKLDDLPHNVKGLLIQQPKKEGNVFLNDKTIAFIDVLLFEWRNKDTYNLHNIPARNKILLHGPTGNGKTTIARHIASKFELPFVEINSDNVIDSHVGSSSRNIQTVLNTITEPCVLFWDEIDTIGYKRGGGDSAAATENARMVNSMLINIERLADTVIFIGATNRVEVLDSAFLRRFDVSMEIAAPSIEEKNAFVSQLLSYHKLPISYVSENLSNLTSFSEIKNKIIEAGRSYLLSLQQKHE